MSSQHPERRVSGQDRCSLLALGKIERVPEQRLKAGDLHADSLSWAQEEPQAQLRAARRWRAQCCRAEQPHGGRLDHGDTRFQPAQHLDQVDDHRSGTGRQAGQRLLVELDFEQIDDPVLGAEVGGLHGLEEEVLRRRKAIGGGDGHGCLEDPRLGQTDLDPGPSYAARSPRWRQPRLRHSLQRRLENAPSHTPGDRERSPGGPSGVVATTLMASCC